MSETAVAPDSITLRRITPADEPFLFELYASTREEELALVPWSEEKKREFLRMQFEAQQVAYQNNYPGASLDVILEGGRPAGRFYVYRSSTEIRIVDVALFPEWRRRGIGSRLLREICEESERSGVPVTIHVEKNNPAMHLYERMGFEPAEDKGFYVFMRRASNAQLNTAS